MKETVEVWFDGSCGPKNPGGTMGFGFVVRYNGADWLSDRLSMPPDPENSNNKAEYLALRAALRWLRDNGMAEKEIRVRGDSDLVIRQVTGKWKVKAGKRYSAVAREVCAAVKAFPHLTFEWVSRKHNTVADQLSRPA